MTTPVESVQLVVYPKAAPKHDAVELWRVIAATAERPDAFQKIVGGTEASGVVGDALLTLQVQAQRVDIVVAPTAERVENDGLFADARQGLDVALAAARRLLVKVQPDRVAIVIKGFRPTDSYQQSVALVQELVPGLVAFAGAVDLGYHTAATRVSRAQPSLSLMRIVRWSTAKRQVLQIVAGASSAVVMDGAPGVATYVDVASQRGDKLYPKKAPEVLDELAEEAVAILDGGYGSIV